MVLILTSHESGHVLQGDVLVPLVLALGDLAENESDGGHGAGHQRGQHQELEPPDEALVVQAADARHGGNCELKSKRRRRLECSFTQKRFPLTRDSYFNGRLTTYRVV